MQVTAWNWLMELAHQRRLTTQDRPAGQCGPLASVLSD